MKAKMVWPCFKAFWFSNDNPTGHSERKKKEADRRRGGKTISKSGQEWTVPAQLGQLKNRTKWKGVVANSSVVPRRPSRLGDRTENR